MTSRALIVGGLSQAIGFLRPAWASAWAAMLVTAGLVGGLWAFGLLSPSSPWRVEAFLVAWLASVMVQGALYRLALGGSRAGPGGLQWTAVEWRLCAVWGLTVVFLFVLGLLGFVILLAFAFATASSGSGFVVALPSTWAGAVDDRGRGVVTVVAIGVSAGLIWASLRICLASAASVAKGRVQVLASWPDTRGVVARLFVSKTLLALTTLGVAAAIAWLASGAPPPMVWVASLVVGLTVAGLWLPMSVGLMAYFFRSSTTP